MDQLVDNGISGVVVKITQGGAKGDNYYNPNASQQIQAAKNRGMKVSLYHHAKYQGADQARAEANFFASRAQALGFGKDVLMVDDVEDKIITDTYNDTIAFQAELARLGYHNQVIYSMASWFWNNKLPRTYPAWVARYNASDSGVSDATAWQYTNHFNGMHVDASYDYGGLFTSKEPITRINFVPGYGIMLWTGYDIYTRQPTGRYLPHGSSWKVVLQAKIHGEYWYALGYNQWIPARYTSNPNGYSNVETVLPNSDPNGTPIATINYLPGYGVVLWDSYDLDTRQPTGRYLPDGSDWKIIAQVKSNGEYWYELGKNQWIPAKFATNPNGFTQAPTLEN
ncbi:hypothetical protein XA3_20410 [Xylocopilactobacillus apicola]|uniref:Lysozyme n=2 Tax=Xylocopilactobacillus apicola TaxID=2932184 RepID=A0AAU9DAZ4_9LACO|nr:hypothetical protein XA3_20410 [Xylocopilactobacillus apicola]